MSARSPSLAAVRTPIVWLAAIGSGGAGLAYELSWSRALVVPLGNSSDAAALVLAGFMLGLALGAWVGGVRAERARSPLRTYAALELGLAAVALVLPAALGALRWLPCWGRYPAALLLVAAPCLAMGATFPLLVRALARDGRALRARVGITYGANTLGAAIGACATGYFGIAVLGVTGSSWAGAGAGVVAASLALLVAGAESRARLPPALAQQAVGSPDARAAALPATPLLFAAAVGGFTMLAAEVLWARVLTFVFGHDAYAFATLLAVVLAGLALGGFVHRLLARWHERWVVAGLLAALGLTLLGSYWATSWVILGWGRDPLGLDATGRLAVSPWLELARELVLTPGLVLAPAVAAGALLPAVCVGHARCSETPVQRVGEVILVNGAGAVLGALVASAGIGSLFGIHDAFRLLAALALGTSAAVILLAAGRDGKRWLALAPLGTLAGMLLALPAALPRQLLLAAVGPRHQSLLHYEEARTGTISVIVNAINGEKQLVINAVNEVTTRVVHDQSFALLGHLGPLLHPDPRRAVMICLGAGLSAGAAMTHPLTRLDVVDLSAAVPRGARHFAAENLGVLDEPRLHLHTDDGRRFLLDATEPYDLAIIDSTHPKAVDSWILYTREFYQQLRARLAPEGLVVQWLPLHGLSEREFKIVVRTFLDVFADGTLWANVGFETYGQVGYAKLVARRDGPLRIDVERLARRVDVPRVRDSLARWGQGSVTELLAAYVGGPTELEAFTRGLPIQTDDRPLIAFTTQWSRGRRMVPRLLLAAEGPLEGQLDWTPSLAATLGPRLTAERAVERCVRAGQLSRAIELAPSAPRLRLYAEQQATTLPYYQTLAERYADDPSTLYAAGTQLGVLGHPEPALAVLSRARALAPKDFRIALHHALARRANGDPAGALAELDALRRRAWGAVIVHQNLGAVLLDEGEPGVAASHLETALALDPASFSARLLLAEARRVGGEPHRALELALAVTEQEPWSAEAHGLAARAALDGGDCARAAACAERAVQLDPMVAAQQRILAESRECLGDVRGSEAAMRAAAFIDPRDVLAQDHLGRLLTRRGEIEAGLEHHVNALEAAPDSAELAWRLGSALLEAGRRQDARAALCLALRLHPGHRAARVELRRLGEEDGEECAEEPRGGSALDGGDPAAAPARPKTGAPHR